MSNFISKMLIFAAGAAIGSFATYKVLKRKYEEQMNTEIDSIREMYGRHFKEKEETAQEETHEEEVPEKEPAPSLHEIKEYLDKARTYLGTPEPKKEEVYTIVNKKEPYIIEPGEFGEEDGYNAISLTYYADGIITDEWDNVIEDPDSMIGPDALDHFGEYEDDSVFVRNEDLKSDFEILADVRRWADIPDKDKHDYTLDDDE